MIQERADRPTGYDGTHIAPELRVEANHLRHLSGPKLTALIYDEPSDDTSHHWIQRHWV